MSAFQALWHWLEHSATAIGAVQNVVTAVAIVAAAFWFARRRLRFPRARVDHTVTAMPVVGNKILLRIQARIENVGDVLMRLKRICLYVQQVRPLHASIAALIAAGESDPIKPGECELPWPALIVREYDWRRKPYEVEPGEVETCNFDVIVPSEMKTLQIYTHVENRVKWFKKIGWNTTSIYEIDCDASSVSCEGAEAPGPEEAASSKKEQTERSMSNELKKQSPPKQVPPLTQGPRKEPAAPPPPPPQKK